MSGNYSGIVINSIWIRVKKKKASNGRHSIDKILISDDINSKPLRGFSIQLKVKLKVLFNLLISLRYLNPPLVDSSFNFISFFHVYSLLSHTNVLQVYLFFLSKFKRASVHGPHQRGCNSANRIILEKALSKFLIEMMLIFPLSSTNCIKMSAFNEICLRFKLFEIISLHCTLHSWRTTWTGRIIESTSSRTIQPSPNMIMRKKKNAKNKSN